MNLIHVAFATALVAGALASPACLDNEGKPVAWTFTYKLPNGYDIAYVDVNSPSSSSKTMSLYSRSLDDTKNPVALIRTLLSIADGAKGLDGVDFVNTTRYRLRGATRRAPHASDTSFLLYNDQPDKGSASETYGHTKGVLAAGSRGGFWLVHSTPHWPLSNGKKQFYFPESEIKFGQTFLCVSLSTSEIDTVAGQLLYNTPFVYHSTFTSSDKSKYPTLAKVLDGEWITEAGTHIATVGSRFGHTFTSFAKNAAWGDDLYASLVGAHYKCDMMVETWLRGDKEGSYCRPKHKLEVVDVKAMSVKTSSGNVTWTESQDHAKWAIAISGPTNTVCVGDINRMTTQRKRGGGAVCFSQAAIANQLYNSVTESFMCKSCKKTKGKKKC